MDSTETKLIPINRTGVGVLPKKSVFLGILVLIVLIVSTCIILSKNAMISSEDMNVWDTYIQPTQPPDLTKHTIDVSSAHHGVSVIVPCIPEDVPKLPSLISNVNRQTRKPDEVVIGLSEMPTKVAKELEEKLQQVADGYHVKILPNSKRTYAGGNRNRAVQGSSGDLLFFIDADDTMNPHRIEIITRVFDQLDHKPGIILHGYRGGKSPTTRAENHVKQKFETEILDDLLVRPPALYKSRTKHKHHDSAPLYGYHIHHGHPVVKRRVFEKQQFNPGLRRGQDTEFINRVLYKYKDAEDSVYYLKLPLTNYIIRSKQKEIIEKQKLKKQGK